MIKKLINLILPIGLILLLISNLSGHYNIIADYSRGFLTGLSGVFITFGLIYTPIFLVLLLRNKSVL